MDFAISADYSLKMKGKQKVVKYLNLAGDLKKYVKHVGDSGTNNSWCASKRSPGLGKKAGVKWKQSKNRDHRKHGIVGID